MPYPRAATCVDPESSVRGGPTLTTLNAGLLALLFFRGSGPILLRNPKLCDFSVCVCGGGVRTPCPPLSILARGAQAYTRTCTISHNTT